MSDQPSRGLVLVTGASTGIGRASASHLAQLGFRVLAGVRSETDAKSIADEASAGRLNLRPLRWT